MSRLVRLYPTAWRERYESEFAQLLGNRPLDRRGMADIVRGAIDAHVHPELIGAVPQPWTHRLPGLLAVGAGLTWSWFWVRACLAAPNEEWGDTIGIAILLMIVSLPGGYVAVQGRRIAVVLAAIAAAFFLARLLPWSVGDGVLNYSMGGAAYLLVGGGVLTLAAIRAGIRPRQRWILAIAAIVIPAAIAIPVLGGFGPTDRGGMTAMLVALLPYGIAWTVIGVRMTLRGSATIVDHPAIRVAPEVSAT